MFHFTLAPGDPSSLRTALVITGAPKPTVNACSYILSCDEVLAYMVVLKYYIVCMAVVKYTSKVVVK